MGDMQAATRHCLSITAASYAGDKNQFQLKPQPRPRQAPTSGLRDGRR